METEKTLLIMVLVILLGAAGAAGTWYFLAGNAPTQVADTPKTAPQAPAFDPGARSGGTGDRTHPDGTLAGPWDEPGYDESLPKVRAQARMDGSAALTAGEDAVLSRLAQKASEVVEGATRWKRESMEGHKTAIRKQTGGEQYLGYCKQQIAETEAEIRRLESYGARVAPCWAAFRTAAWEAAAARAKEHAADFAELRQPPRASDERLYRAALVSRYWIGWSRYNCMSGLLSAIAGEYEFKDPVKAAAREGTILGGLIADEYHDGYGPLKRALEGDE